MVPCQKGVYPSDLSFLLILIQSDCRLRTVTGELQVTFRGLEQDTVKTADELKKEIQSKGRGAWLLSSSVTLLAQGKSQYL